MYPALSIKKFSIIKSGPHTILFLVDRRGELQKESLFLGNLASIDGLPQLQKRLEDNIRSVMIKYNYV